MSKHAVRRQPYTLPAIQEEEEIVTKEFLKEGIGKKKKFKVE